MTIERLETFTGPTGSVVRVTSDDGDMGIGQMKPGNDDFVTQVFHRFIAPHALGEDPSNIDGVIDGFMEAAGRPRPYKHPGTFLLRALSGLDTALWDLKGKRHGESVRDLLGGGPDKVGAYGSRLSRETSPEEEIDVCTKYRDTAGLEAFKLKIGKRLAFRTDEDVWPGRTEEVVSGVRDAMGDNVDLLVDANGAYSAEKAIEVAENTLVPNDVVHYEEPCPHWELEWTDRVRNAVDIPVAGGEQDNMFQQWGKTWERIVGAPVVDIAQPDIGYIGGVTRAKRIADLAADAGLMCVPHGPDHTLQKVFTIHLMAAVENSGPYPFEYRIPEDRPRGEMYSPEPTVEDGMIPVPSGPGWGVELNPKWLAKSDYAVSEL